MNNEIGTKEVSNDTVFFLHKSNKNESILKLCENGDIYVKGKLIENDIEVVDALREFLKVQGFNFKNKTNE